METNPFFEIWNTPFGVPPFDAIRPEDFPPAYDRGMADHLAEIEAIADSNETPGFANTIEALERSGRLLNRVGSVFHNLVASQGGEVLQAIERDYAPRIARHGMEVSLNAGLFRRIADLHDRRAALGLDPVQLRLLERTHLRFVRNGAALSPDRKARMTEITGRLATLHTQFGQNVLHDEKEWMLPLAEADLAGLPEFIVAGAAQSAAERGREGGWVITLSRSLIEPFLCFSPRRDLRRVAHAAWIARGAHDGAHDNRPLMPEILALRHERAQLLGYATYADFRLADTMAGTPEAVAGLTTEVWTAARRKAEHEAEALLRIARADGVTELEPWDWRYYAEKLRQSAYAIDEADVKPYFALDNMQLAAFETANRLFGLEFIARPDIPTYHPDVRAYEVRDAARGGAAVGVFLADHFARPDKRSGAWMSSYRDQETLDGAVLPIIVNNNNFARATPCLLSFDDAETLFHEFGHALHGLLSEVRYPSQSGTSVRRDFVEFPSQIYEHWLAQPAILRRHARHHETGEPIPDQLIQRLLAARNFNQGFATVEYTASAILDMELHAHPAPGTLDVAAFENEAMARLGLPHAIGPRHRAAHFQHLFAGGGYAAGYYSYLWAEILDADGFKAFAEADDPFDPPTAARLRDILKAGDTSDPMELYIAFRGHAPSTAALLESRNLLEPAL
jgi:peptidyl-dipeptidase Dcp